MEKRTASDYRVSAWSGGTTTQLAIFPETAGYADRDFLWRVSSATVELETSDFTPLPDYDRLIATLEGRIVLTHNGGAPITLQPFEVHAFSGADETRSVGRCRDFNLMLRRGRVRGSMEARELTETPIRVCADAAGEQLLVYCASGQCTATEETAGTGIACPPTFAAAADSAILHPGESLLCTAPACLTLRGNANLMICRMLPVKE